MGQIYRRRLEEGESQDYQKEQALAIEYFCKAVHLQKELNLEIDLAKSGLKRFVLLSNYWYCSFSFCVV
jgi:hypothetical protein